jgi:Uma2 family endonuclease
MNVQTKRPTTSADFLAWNEGQEGKWDLVAGRIVDMMVRVSRNHALLAARMVAILSRSLSFPPYTISTADFGVTTATSVRYPDVMVDGAMGNGTDLTAVQPLLIVEILSPSTMPIDFGPKLEEYKTISGLKHYVILAQGEIQAWVWSRDDKDEWAEPELESNTLKLGGIAVAIDLKELYAGVVSRK